LLNDLLILLAASLPIAFLCSRFRLPVIVGFMLTGVLIGPAGLGLIRQSQDVELLAEIGVVLLLFTIGLEFSLKRLLEMKRLVLGGGGLQVTITTLVVLALSLAVGRSFNQSLFYGFLFALSSTAIVLKSYMDRLEIDTPHGRAGVGILLFQDLCIVPMMLLTPILSGQEGSSFGNIALRIGTALAVVAGIIVTARTIVPFLLHHIVRLRSPEVFIIFVVLVSLGTAWLTSLFGMSMALGAFVAGLVLSESEYSHQIVSDIMPFRDVFNSVFFISIGMLLSVGFLLNHLLIVLLWVVALIVGKALITLLALRLLGNSLRIAAMVGIGLAQVGEFSFILAKVGAAQGLLPAEDYQQFLAAAILSMIATPLLISLAPRFGMALQARLAPHSRLEPRPVHLPGEEELEKHVIVVGYGLNGRNLACVLERAGIPYRVLELNAETVRQARAAGVPIEYGDALRREVMSHAGIQRAAVLVLAISDPLATRHIVALARELRSDLHIIVRTRYLSELPELYKLGATQVIPEEFETSIEIFARVLEQYEIAPERIQREAEIVRRAGYEILRAETWPTDASEPLAKVEQSESLNETPVSDSPRP
jgi:CPA2 family monovalent cation:H+ antiporter-2